MELKLGYKQTNLGVKIPNEWAIKKFKDVSYMKGRIGWQGLNQTEFTENTEEPFLITGMNFKNGAIRWNEVYHISEERYNIAKEIQLKPNDVLMTKDGTIGKLLFVDTLPYPHKATLNSHLLLFRPLNKSYHPKYLYYNLGSPFFLNHIEITKSGTTFFGVSQESVGEYDIILPPLPEQTAIANALSDMDALISQTEKLIEKKKAIKQGAMQELLKPKEGWVTKKLKEIATFRRGSFPQPYGLDKWYDDISGQPFVQVFDVNKNKQLKSETKRYISKEAQKQSVFAKKGTIVLTIQGSIGRIAITQYDAYIDRTLLIFESYLVPFDPYFFMLTIHQLFEIEEQNAPGGIIKTITKEALSSFTISYPVLEEQIKIGTLLKDIENEIELIEIKLNKLKRQKQGMMQVLLTGKIRLVS